VEGLDGAIQVTSPAAPEHRDDIETMEVLLRDMDAGRVGMAKPFSAEPADDETQPYVVPDLFVQARETDDADRAWARANHNHFPAAMLALVVGVTTTGSRHRDLGGKVAAYAGMDIAVYIVVDRQEREVIVHHEPDPAKRRYAAVARVPFGTPAPLPEPFTALDTTTLV
jgi:hypothetical protein